MNPERGHKTQKKVSPQIWPLSNLLTQKPPLLAEANLFPHLGGRQIPCQLTPDSTPICPVPNSSHLCPLQEVVGPTGATVRVWVSFSMRDLQIQQDLETILRTPITILLNLASCIRHLTLLDWFVCDPEPNFNQHWLGSTWGCGHAIWGWLACDQCFPIRAKAVSQVDLNWNYSTPQTS